ncbi:MAG: putative cysteine peptidase [Bacillales bacterium]
MNIQTIFLISVSLNLLPSFNNQETKTIINKLKSLKTSENYSHSCEYILSDSFDSVFDHDEICRIVELEHNDNFNTNNFFKLKFLKTISDDYSNKFYLASFSPYSYSILTTETLEPLQIEYYNKQNLSEEDEYTYVPLQGIEIRKPLTKYKNKYYKFDYSKSIDNKIELIKKNNFKNYTKRYNRNNNPAPNDENPEIIMDFKIKNSWFFENFKSNFGYADVSYLSNPKYNLPKEIQDWAKQHSNVGLCEYIALSLLLQYNEMFVSQGYFNDDEINKYFEFNNSPSLITSIPKVSERLVIDLFLKNNKAYNINCTQVVNATHAFLKNKNIKYSVAGKYSVFASPADVIKNNRPVMLSFITDLIKMEGHNVVAYGYRHKNDTYLCHYGWENDDYKNCKKIYSRNLGFLYDFHIYDHNENVKPRKMFMVNGELVHG